MSKATFKVGLFLCALVFLSSGSRAYAATPSDMISSADSFTINKLASSANPKDLKPKNEAKVAEKPVAAPVKKKPVQHVVIEGETLTVIAEKNASTWTKLFEKNTQIAHPDIVNVGETVTVPFADEQLPERPLPAPQPQIVAEPVVVQSQSDASYQPVNRSQANSGGNTYSAGYCTWYAKDRRPDLPNSLGNADTWVTRAQAMGYATGSTPSPGAIGQQGMHVVYVESVNGDGTVTVSEMNYQGLYVTSSRTVPAGSFMYIY